MIGAGNRVSHIRCQAIGWISADLLPIGPNFYKISNIHDNSFENVIWQTKSNEHCIIWLWWLVCCKVLLKDRVYDILYQIIFTHADILVVLF